MAFQALVTQLQAQIDDTHDQPFDLSALKADMTTIQAELMPLQVQPMQTAEQAVADMEKKLGS